jgi:hypothetical protein
VLLLLLLLPLPLLLLCRYCLPLLHLKDCFPRLHC